MKLTNPQKGFMNAMACYTNNITVSPSDTYVSLNDNYKIAASLEKIGLIVLTRVTGSLSDKRLFYECTYSDKGKLYMKLEQL